ncbi:MAG: 1-acyl-sn-glycerol-3-phosphate acyltransferase [Chloroflexi bacterium]|nr:MAG: 1-acyl-sn-glycerol-3-phosphate acyltransferase [Chloroflexota bacterium]HEY73014.1 1-acyl-sn-glycerol-3-phosphate acyltransferase [Thermoflexia bacterium]
MKPTLVREQTLTYRTVTSSIKCLTRILCRIDGAQLEQVPGQGPLIIVINHVNFLEAPIFYTHLDPRPLTGFVKAEQLEHPIFGPLLIDLWGGIPIRRGEADVTAFRQAFEALEEGQILAVAPEGTRSGHGRLQQGHPGTALLALRSGAPVLPIVCYGGEIFWNNLRRLRRTDFHAVVGQSFYLDASGDRVTRQVRQRMTDEIMYQLASLLPPAYRGVYSDMSAATETYLRFPPGAESNLSRVQDLVEPKCYDNKTSEVSRERLCR